MAAFEALIEGLRRAEQQLEKQLAGIRSAITSLDFGSTVKAAVPGRNSAALQAKATGGRKRRKMSAAARKAISDAQKRRWAKQKAAAAAKK
jgi:hypothetical protein